MFKKLLCAALICGGVQFALAEQPAPYHSMNGYSVEFPAEGKQNVIDVFTFPSQNPYFKNSLNIMVQDVSETVKTLEEYTQLTVSQYEQMKAMPEITDTVVDGLPAKQLIVEVNNLKFLQIFLIKDEKEVYLLTYTSLPLEFDSNLPAVQKVLASWKLK